MPHDRVQCSRDFAVSGAPLWAVLRGFDLNWHPFVTSCDVLRGAGGSILRAFVTADGGHLVEQRTYLSDSDRVLCYTALSGIEGALRYEACVEVVEQGGQCQVTWSADVTASSERIARIVEGTRVVFEAGLDALGGALAGQGAGETTKRVKPAKVRRVALEGTPRLSFLSGETDRSKGGPLVLCLHGIGGQASNWSDQIEAFGADCRIASMDLRGYGDSSLGPIQTGIDDYCDDILRVAECFRAEQLVLVGLSMGSWIATSFAMRHGERLAGLVLAGGCTGMSQADPVERETFRASREVPLSQGQTPADFADAVVNVIAGPNASDAVKATLHTSMSDIPSQTYRDALNCFCNPTETFDFTKIACPVLLVTGAQDRLASPSEIRQVSQRIFKDINASGRNPDVGFEVLQDCGHLCNLEQPKAFNALLAQFLHRLPDVSVRYKPSRGEKRRRKRDQILRAAHVAFCEVGFDGVSMDRLAKAAEVSKPTLYQYFGDKEGLFAAVLDDARAHIVAPLADREGRLVDRLWRFSWTYGEFVLRPDMLSLARLILGEAGRRPESAISYHQGGPARAFDGLVEFVSAADAAGELDVDDPKLAANDLWSLILSGPRDYYLHHVNERPSQTELLGVIGHGLSVFLKAYSCHPVEDQKALAGKIEAKRRELANESG